MLKTHGLHKIRIISGVAQKLYASQEGICYLGLVSLSVSQHSIHAYPDVGKNL